MCKIEDIDKNFTHTELDGFDLVFCDVKNEPFSVSGLFGGDGFRRLPPLTGVCEGVNILSRNTAGGKVRFSTNSPYVAIYAEIGEACHMGHMTLAGSCGFDLYRLEDGEERFVSAFIPPTGIVHGHEHFHSIKRISDTYTEMTSYTLYMPLYNGVNTLHIGLAPESRVEKGADFMSDKPIVYYGSSITQGGCASRPGNAYPALITHKLNVDHVNLGFSGSAIGETAMAQYIGAMQKSAFVYDYDYNAPTLQHLADTHEAFFKELRRAAPLLPVIMISAPSIAPSEHWSQRRDVIKRTYENAVAAGDKNVYFLDGGHIFDGLFADCSTVDGVHPNDLGFARMAEKLLPIVKKALRI